MFSFAVGKRMVLSCIGEMNNALEFLISALFAFFVVKNQAFEPIRKSNGSNLRSASKSLRSEVKILGASPEAFKYAGGFERLDERSKLRGIGPASE